MIRTRYAPLTAPSLTPQTIEPQFGEAEPRPGDQVISEAEGSNLAQFSDAPVLVAENDDPDRPRLHARTGRRRKSFIRGMARLFQKRELTAEEELERAEFQARLSREKLLRTEALIAKRRIVGRLDALGFCYRYSDAERKKTFFSDRRSVKVIEIRLTDEALYFRLDVQHMPPGVRVIDIMAEAVLNELSLSCERRVLSKYSEAEGAWYIVERAAGVMGIPSHVKLSDVWERFPVTAGGMTIPLGVGINSSYVYRDLRTMPHVLIAGTTGGGKSNMLNAILMTLLRRNRPENLQLVMIDLKGGLELKHYSGIPHLWNKYRELTDGIATTIEDVPNLLSYVIQEAEDRMHEITKAGYSDIVDYNARRSSKRKLPRILIAFDELASLTLLDPRIGKQATALLTDLGNRGRAVGVHLIACTQYPNKQVLSPAIKAVLNAKMAFACSQLVASQIILGNGDAKGLAPAGRYVWQSGAEQMTVQAPLFPKSMRDEMLAALKSGVDLDIGKRGHDVTELEVMEWALNNNKGLLPVRRIYQVFSNRGLTLHEIERWLLEWDGKQFRVNEAYYTVEKPIVNRPRILKPSENSETFADEE